MHEGHVTVCRLRMPFHIPSVVCVRVCVFLRMSLFKDRLIGRGCYSMIRYLRSWAITAFVMRGGSRGFGSIILRVLRALPGLHIMSGVIIGMCIY